MRPNDATPLKERFLQHVILGGNGCLYWTGTKNINGYGVITTGSRSDGSHRSEWAHRVSYRLFNGSIHNGLCVLHKCDHPLCVNPCHLELGTKAENNHQMAERGRACKGMAHHSCRLNKSQVREIRMIGRDKPQREIAKLYGISHSSVQKIQRRKTWRHV